MRPIKHLQLFQLGTVECVLFDFLDEIAVQYSVE